jgi:hypothetical protein
MPQYKAPGVYVEEVERGAKPIEGVGTSTAGFLGETERGPTDPRLVTSYADYQRLFGGVVEDKYLAQSVDGFFRNGGSQCYVGRVTAATETGYANLAAYSSAAGTLVLTPDTVDFGRVASEASTTRTVVVHHRGPKGDDPVTISGLSLSGGDSDRFEIETAVGDGITLKPGDARGLRVTFTAVGSSGTPGERTATLEATYEVPGSGSTPTTATATTTLAAEGVSTGDGVLGVSTRRVDFGSVVAENQRVETVTVTNLGSTDVDVTGTNDLSGTAFSVEHDFSSPLTVPAGGSETVEITFAPETTGPKNTTLELAHDGTSSPLTIDLVADVTAATFRFEAVGPGDWAEGVAVTVDDASLFDADENDLFQLTIRYWGDPEDRAAARAVFADPDREADDAPDPDVEETYDNLSTVESSSDFYEKRVNGSSTLLDAVEIEGVSVSGTRPANGTTWLGVADESPTLAREHFEGDATVEPDERTGFAGFDLVDEIAIVCVPDEHSYNFPLTDLVVGHCVDRKDRFAVLQASQSPGPPGGLSPSARSDYAAFYYPWLKILHPETGREQLVPPGGHIAGIYARSDQQHGVHKAPANEQVRGIQGLQVDISKGDQAILNPRGVNCIRTFRGRGTRVWGARTTSSDPAWKYVNVRRLFLFVEESIDEGTQWVVFEPNDEQLWARVRQTIRNFLTSVWQDGALMGTTPEEAFYVKCDRSTMTQNDIDNGRLICEIGIAPVKPAEFVIFRISQKTASAE